MPTSQHDKRLRAQLATELGWYPADLDDEPISRHRADAAAKKTDHDPAKVRSGVPTSLHASAMSGLSGAKPWPTRMSEP